MQSVLLRLCAILALLFSSAHSLLAQNISISLRDSKYGLIHTDSANWNEAWIELDGTKPDAKKLGIDDLLVTDGERGAKVLSIDSIGFRFKSHLALSFVLDNSGSMFHAYDSLAHYCDSLLDSLPKGTVVQAVTFDTRFRNESHLYTARKNVFISQCPFTESPAGIKYFWHYYDSIRTQYTPLYDAIAAAITNIDDRSLHGDTSWSDVLIVVTDGADNASRTSIELLQQLLSNNRLRLFAINFRTDEDARLQWLARRSGGEYMLCDNFSDLRTTLADIRHSTFRQYHIKYLFPSAGPSGSH